jgi:hypothetical protein
LTANHGGSLINRIYFSPFTKDRRGWSPLSVWNNLLRLRKKHTWNEHYPYTAWTRNAQNTYLKVTFTLSLMRCMTLDWCSVTTHKCWVDKAHHGSTYPTKHTHALHTYLTGHLPWSNRRRWYGGAGHCTRLLWSRRIVPRRGRLHCIIYSEVGVR